MIILINNFVKHLTETTLEMVEFNLNLYTSKYQQSILCFALRLEDFLYPGQYPLVDLVNTDLPVLAGGRWRVAEGDLLVLLVLLEHEHSLQVEPVSAGPGFRANKTI